MQTVKQLEKTLAPFDLHCAQEAAHYILAMEGESALALHPASVLRLARDALLHPQGGGESLGELTWDVGPGEGGEGVAVCVRLEQEEHRFMGQAPWSPAQLARACTEHSSPALRDYLQVMGPEGRAKVWHDMARDCAQAALRMTDARRLAGSARLPLLLRDAITRGNAEGVEDALELGADPNGPDAEGNRPLHLAVLNEHPELVVPLVHAGARVNATNAQGMSALHMAASQHFARGCLALMAMGADPHQLDAMDRTPADHGRGRWRPRQVEHAQGL